MRFDTSLLMPDQRGALPEKPGYVRMMPDKSEGRKTNRVKDRRLALEPSDLAHLIVEKLEEHQAVDIVLLDLRELTPLADYFIVCTAESERQTRSLQEIVLEELKKERAVRPLSTEGEPASGWVLLDYNSVVVHVFSKDARAYYRLEELWRAAPVVLKIK